MESAKKFIREVTKKWGSYIFISLCLLIAFLAIGKMKSGYHVDEMFTFILSNHPYDTTNTIDLKVNDGVSYTGTQLWNENLMVDADHRFDYANVWKNQAADVHPPLYYVLIHTACSLFPTLSIKTIGVLINAILAIIVFWQLVWIMRRLQLDKNISIFLALTYILSTGFLGYAIVFLRMYTLLAVWMNFLIMLFLKYPADERVKPSYCISLGAVFLGGILTQYYFMIFAFFSCLVYAVYVGLGRNWKKLIFSILTAAAAGILALAIFPGMWFHIFEGGRGKEAFENVTTGGFLENLWKYLDLINSNIYGGLFSLLLAVLACLLIVLSVKEKIKVWAYPYALLILPVCLYVMVIAKIAPFQVLRYCISNMGLLYVGIFCGLYTLAKRISKTARGCILALALVMLFAGYRQDIELLYLGEKSNVAKVQENENLPCLYLYDDGVSWKMQPNLIELYDLKDIMFINVANWEEEKGNIYQNQALLVYIDSDYTYMLDALKEQTGLSNEEYLFTSGYATAYILQ